MTGGDDFAADFSGGAGMFESHGGSRKDPFLARHNAADGTLVCATTVSDHGRVDQRPVRIVVVVVRGRLCHERAAAEVEPVARPRGEVDDVDVRRAAVVHVADARRVPAAGARRPVLGAVQQWARVTLEAPVACYRG